MCDYSVFGDESYDEKRERVFAVAGLFGNEAEWSSFETAWTTLTNGQEFHASNCERAGGHKLYADLTQTLAQSNLFGFGVAMSLIDFDSIFSNRADDNVPYYACFTRVVAHFAKFTSLVIPQGRVKFTFDRNAQVQHNAATICQHSAEMKDWEFSRFLDGQLSISTRTNPRIQAADLWAREVMKHMDNTIVCLERRPMRLSLVALRKTKRFGFDMFDKEYFEDMKRKTASAPAPDVEKYHAWRERHGLQDNMTIRIQYEEFLGTLQGKTGE